MGSEREIRRSIKSVRNIQQITKAMKMVAAARIKKAEARMRASRPFAYKYKEVVEELISQSKDSVHPLMQWRPPENVMVFMISADKGLCGSYNTNVLRMTLEYLHNISSSSRVHLVVLGQKGTRALSKKGFTPLREFIKWEPTYELAVQLADLCNGRFSRGEVDEVLCFYTRSLSSLQQKASVEKILPLKQEGMKGKILPIIYEPSPLEALDLILPRYLEVIFYQTLLEARAAELGARLRAMSNATENAEKLISELTLKYFRARQEAITTEILEVATGAEALRRM